MNSIFISIFLYICSLSFIISADNSLSETVIYIRSDEETFSINLNENPLGIKLVYLLPLKTIPTEKNKFIYLPLSFEIENENSFWNEETAEIEADEGDIIIFQRKELIIVNRKITFDNTNGEYIKIGKTECINELYDKIKFNKTIYLWNSFNYKNYNENIKPHEHYSLIMYYITMKIVTVMCFLFFYVILRNYK